MARHWDSERPAALGRSRSSVYRFPAESALRLRRGIRVAGPTEPEPDAEAATDPVTLWLPREPEPGPRHSEIIRVTGTGGMP